MSPSCVEMVCGSVADPANPKAVVKFEACVAPADGSSVTLKAPPPAFVRTSRCVWALNDAVKPVLAELALICPVTLVAVPSSIAVAPVKV